MSRGSTNSLTLRSGLLPLVQRVSLLVFTSYEKTSPGERAEVMWKATSVDFSRHVTPPMRPGTSDGRVYSFSDERSRKRSEFEPFSLVTNALRFAPNQIVKASPPHFTSP